MTSTNDPERPVRLLWIAGYLMLASGLAHTLMLGWGGGWSGEVSWRKPILFGISTGLTACSIAWIATLVRPRPRDRWQYNLTAIALVLEVGLITLQQWRGVPSHFNHATILDATIDIAVAFLVSLAVIVILDLTVRSFGPLRAGRDQRWAIRGGLAYLALSCLIGFVIAIYGNWQSGLGHPPGTVGQAGVAKFPHGFSIHAVQVFPVCCVLLAWLGVNQHARVRAMQTLQIATAGGLVFSIWQTINGRGRLDFEPIGLAGLLLTLALMWLPWGITSPTSPMPRKPLQTGESDSVMGEIP